MQKQQTPFKFFYIYKVFLVWSYVKVMLLYSATQYKGFEGSYIDAITLLN